MGSGIRDCYVPRPGWVYCSIDYAALEMVTLAQCTYEMFGYSVMRDSINEDEDQHCRLVASMIGEPYTDVVAKKNAGDARIKNLRQAAKAGNFGFAGGMGPAKFAISKRRTSPTTSLAASGSASCSAASPRARVAPRPARRT
jgi:DNA polymerase-1